MNLAADFQAMADTLRPSADTLALRRRAMVIEPVTLPAVAQDYARYTRTCSLCDSPSTGEVCGRCSAYFERGGRL